MILEKLKKKDELKEKHIVILLDIGSRQECQANLGARGGGGGSKGRWLGRGERGSIGDGLGEWEWEGRKDGYGSREVYISTKGAILGFPRDLILEGFPGPRRDPQIVPWTGEERVPELALSHNHSDEYFAYHHRTFIW